jgi:hypothetical protein
MNYRQLTFTVISIFLLATTGCAGKATEPVLSDSAFSGQALLDANGNGQIDAEDTPIENATFYVELDGVKAFGDTTDETGNAFIIVPGGVKYPVKVSMEAPKDSTLKLITPSTVTVSASTGIVQFLFSSK